MRTHPPYNLPGPTLDLQGLVQIRLSLSTTASFTGSYNVDGQLTRQVMPDGLEQQFTLNETGDPTSVPPPSSLGRVWAGRELSGRPS